MSIDGGSVIDYDVGMNIPAGTTHFDVTYGDTVFWCRRSTEYSVELCEWYQHWHYWNQGRWVEDRTASSRRFKPIIEYMESQDV